MVEWGKIFIERRADFLWLVLIVVAILVYAAGISHESIWYDEACSAIMAEHPLSEVVVLSAADHHPPLYYSLLRLVRLALGNTPWALRSLSAAAVVALVALGAGSLRRLFDDRTAFIYAVVMLFTPMNLIYAHEARMYALAILAVTAGALYGCLAVEEQRWRDWLIFGLASLAAAYLHYYGLVSAFMTHVFLFGWLLLKKRQQMKAYFFTAIGVVLGYLPWLGTLLGQTQDVEQGFWLTPPTIVDVVAAFYKPFAYKEYYPGIRLNMTLALLLSLLLIMVGLVLVQKKGHRKMLALSKLLLFVYLGTLLVTVGFSLAVAPVFYSRYFMLCAGLFLLLVSLGISQLPGTYLRLAALFLYALLNVFTLRDIYTRQFNYFMKELVQDYQGKVRAGDLMITSDLYSMGPAVYYFPQAEHYYTNNSQEVIFDHVLKPFIPPLHYEENLKKLLSERTSFWYISSNTGLSKNIHTILKHEPGWEPVSGATAYSQPYTPVDFFIQEYVFTGLAQPEQGTLSVHINNLRPSGSFYAVLYDRESPYWSGPLSQSVAPYRYEYIRVESDEMVYSFDGLDYGEYVLVLAHDENGNHVHDCESDDLVPCEGLFIMNAEKMPVSSGLADFSFDSLKFTFDVPERQIEVCMLYPPFSRSNE